MLPYVIIFFLAIVVIDGNEDRENDEEYSLPKKVIKVSNRSCSLRPTIKLCCCLSQQGEKERNHLEPQRRLLQRQPKQTKDGGLEVFHGRFRFLATLIFTA